MHSIAAMMLLLLVQSETRTAPPTDSVLARKLRWAALDQQAVLNLDSALVLLQGARRADPAYLPAQFDYLHLRFARYEDAALRRESVPLARSADPLERCLGIAMAGFTEYRSTDRELLAIERSGGATACSTFFLALEGPRRDYPDSLRLIFVARALRQTPEVPALWSMQSTGFVARGDLMGAEHIVEEGRLAVRHPLL